VDWGKSFANGGKIKFINLKIEHMYGPMDDETKFVPWIIKQLIEEVPEIKLTEGTQKRDFVFIDDVVSAYIATIEYEHKSTFAEFEIGTGISMPLKEFIHKIYRAVEVSKNKSIQTQLKFGAFPMRKGEPNEIKANNTKLNNLGWSVKYDIEEGLKKTINNL
jgi:nucleoside-diphosphate-sugar epimerase